MIKKITGAFNDMLFLPAAVLVFCLLRLPSVIEPYWYGDEGIYQVIGMAMRSGRILYSQIWDNKPPLLYIIYAIFSGDQFYVRLLSLIFGAVSIVVFFFLAKKLFKNKLSIYFSTAFFAVMFGTPILEGNVANAENFMLLPVITAFLFALNSRKKISYVIVSGVLLSLAALVKIVALFDFAALATIIFATRFMDTVSLDHKSIRREIKQAITGFENEVVFGISFAIPIILTALYFLFVGAFPDFFCAVFSQNVGYVSYGNYFLFPNGLLFAKLVLLIFSVLLAFRYRKTLGVGGLAIFIWLFFSLFSAFFSARPYTHYLLVLLPAFSLFLGYVFEQKKLLILTVPLLIVIYVLVNNNFKPNKNVTAYYSNYFSFIDGGSVENYRNFFDSDMQKDYDIVEFIKVKTTPNESIFLWGDNAQIYSLSNKIPPGRYIVAYHVTFYPDAIDETKKAIEAAHPKYIIQTKNDPVIENFLTGYALLYKIDGANIYERQP